LKVIEDAAAGLAYAYSRGVTHRDIKLTNLLISSTGDCKLVDFGLAQLFANVKEKVDRTVDYAGLEKATGVKQGDTRSDIYFLGCILYECLTGRAPLVMTRDRYARMRKDRFEHVAPIRPEEVEAPPSVFSLVETMMSLVPTRRFQTPAQLLDAVRAAKQEVEGRSIAKDNGRPAGRSVFIVEKQGRLQQVLRDAFKERGYRVFMASDPERALDRFRQQPFDALVMDLSTIGESGLQVFEIIQKEAARKQIPVAAVVVLSEEQKEWVPRIEKLPRCAALSYPVGFKKLYHTLKGLTA
jgi:serine/threonine protein kinase